MKNFYANYQRRVQQHRKVKKKLVLKTLNWHIEGTIVMMSEFPHYCYFSFSSTSPSFSIHFSSNFLVVCPISRPWFVTGDNEIHRLR